MDEALEDEFYMRRLDAGLFTLQLIDCIIMEVCCSGVTSVKNTITDIFCSFCSFIVHGKVKSAFEGSSPSGRSLFLFRFCSMKRLGVFLLPPDGMLVPRRVTPSIKFAGAYLYTWVERGTVRVKCFAQEHNTMSPARARTRTARSGVERTNHEATAPPQQFITEEKKGGNWNRSSKHRRWYHGPQLSLLG